MYKSHKRFTILSFSKNINNSIHWYLKNVVCKTPFNLNYSDATTTQSCLSHCAT